MAENIDLTLLATLVRENLAETRALRREVADVRTLSLQTVDYMRRMEQRMDARIDGLEAKIGGVDDRVRAIDDRFRAIDDRFRALDARMASLREDLELMIKSELMGRLAHFETRMENFLHARLSAIERAD
jgi:fumarylacetoacetate (FAA) hydrolase family protein